MSESKLCPYCHRQSIKFMPIRGGRVLAFNNLLIRISDAYGDGWVPMHGPGGIFLRPLGEIPERRLEEVKWVAVRHACAEYEIARTRVLDMSWAEDETKRALMTIAPERKWPRSTRRSGRRSGGS